MFLHLDEVEKCINTSTLQQISSQQGLQMNPDTHEASSSKAIFFFFMISGLTLKIFEGLFTIATLFCGDTPEMFLQTSKHQSTFPRRGVY